MAAASVLERILRRTRVVVTGGKVSIFLWPTFNLTLSLCERLILMQSQMRRNDKILITVSEFLLGLTMQRESCVCREEQVAAAMDMAQIKGLI